MGIPPFCGVRLLSPSSCVVVPIFVDYTIHHMSSDPIVETFAVPPLGCNCTIIGDPVSKDCCVVDPGGNVSKILARIQAHGLTLKRCLTE